MSKIACFDINDEWILACRGRKNTVDPFRPYSWVVEKERTPSGAVEDVLTVFLTNRECPFHCLMCDLWKNTVDEPLPDGALAGQVEWALKNAGTVKNIKLYNSGSFFDKRAVPVRERDAIASIVKGLETVIVESHPSFINDECPGFRDKAGTNLQVAMGLECVNPRILTLLNKRMTLVDFADRTDFLLDNDIFTRAFILLRPPFLEEDESIFWAKKSIDFAFDSGCECCTIIPVRGGNGSMEKLQERGLFGLPSITSLERVLEFGIEKQAGRVFADTWDLELFSKCNKCYKNRFERITAMNLQQRIIRDVDCDCR
ncbi:MAG: hypothetical protein RBT38_02360 [Bacteroidales bacterium]|jgi:radical SAM enzyme (TIGR01210 family)|nr:hypothetical protein [Bacteroidales bacterium]